MYIYLRIVGYVTTIAMHVGNAVWMSTRFHGEVMKNHDVRHFSAMQCFFFTCWTFTFQITYAVISLYCELTTLENSKRPGRQLPKILTDARDAFYIAIVWPSSILVSIMFWSFFFYDRGLLYPKGIDLAISSTSNHIMHTAIVFVMLWEMMLKPRTPPRSHKWYLLAMIGVEVIYFATVHGVYLFKGVWIYPIFGLLVDTVYYYLFFAAVASALVMVYYAHWILNDFVWGSRDRESHVAQISSAKTTINEITSNGWKPDNITKKVE